MAADERLHQLLDILIGIAEDFRFLVLKYHVFDLFHLGG